MQPGAPPVAVINERLVSRYFPNEDPIGRRITLGLPRPDNPWITIIGIAQNVPHRALDSKPEPDWYTSQRRFTAATSLPVCAQRASDVDVDGCDSQRDGEHRSASAADERENDGGGDQHDDRAASLQCSVARRVCGDRAVAGDSRDLQRDFLFDHVTDAGDWHSHGAGRAPACDSADGDAKGNGAHADRNR